MTQVYRAGDCTCTHFTLKDFELKRPTTYTTYRMFRSETRPGKNGKNKVPVLDKEGAVTACCIVDTKTNKMSVGFSFMSPRDQQYLKKGRNRAFGRCKHNPISMRIQRSGEKRLVAETLLAYLFKAATKKNPEKFLHINEYNGKPEKNLFRPWFMNFMSGLAEARGK